MLIDLSVFLAQRSVNVMEPPFSLSKPGLVDKITPCAILITSRLIMVAPASLLPCTRSLTTPIISVATREGAPGFIENIFSVISDRGGGGGGARTFSMAHMMKSTLGGGTRWVV